MMINAVKPRVGIIMGCDSDLPRMKEASENLDEFNVPYYEVAPQPCLLVYLLIALSNESLCLGYYVQFLLIE